LVAYVPSNLQIRKENEMSSSSSEHGTGKDKAVTIVVEAVEHQ
jgi:hypothetical protein